MLRQDTFDSMGQFPTMMGEIGVPFDLDQKKAYRDGDYSAQVRALDASLNACDGSNALNYSIWTYCPDNSHEWGDQWNGEDLSVWSADDKERMLHYRASTSQVDLVGRISNNRNRANSKASSLSSTPFGSVNNSVTRLNVLGDDKSSLRPPTTFSPLASSTSTLASSIATPPPAPARPLYKSTGSFGSNSSDPYQPINQNDGSRALSAFCRPFPVKTVGTPVDINFDIRSSKFSLLVRVDASDVADTTLPTEIYVPLVHYAAYPSRISQLVQDDIDEEEEAAMLEDTALGGYSNDDGKKTTISLSLPDERREEDPRKLALKVKVSDGRWELQDQKLLWYYPRPSKGSITVKIEFEREKGAVPTWVSEWVGEPFGFRSSSAMRRSLTSLPSRRMEQENRECVCAQSPWNKPFQRLASFSNSFAPCTLRVVRCLRYPSLGPVVVVYSSILYIPTVVHIHTKQHTSFLRRLDHGSGVLPSLVEIGGVKPCLLSERR